MKSGLIFYHLFVLLLIYSCVNTEEYQSLKKEFRNVSCDRENINLDSLFYLIPDYTDISNSITAIHKKFKQELILPPENADKYLTSKEAAIAMGMYAADLGYVRHFEKIQLCTSFLDAVNILSNKLAIGNKEFNKMIPEFEQNLDNKKHIFTLIDSLINNSSLFLSGNEQYGLSVLFLSGFWIESSYIGLHGIHNKELEHHKQIISAHFKILNQIIYIFSYVRDEDILDILKNDLIFLESKYSTNDLTFSHIEAIREKYKKE